MLSKGLSPCLAQYSRLTTALPRWTLVTAGPWNMLWIPFLPWQVYNWLVFSFACFSVITQPQTLCPLSKSLQYTLTHQVLYKHHLLPRLLPSPVWRESRWWVAATHWGAKAARKMGLQEPVCAWKGPWLNHSRGSWADSQEKEADAQQRESELCRGHCKHMLLHTWYALRTNLKAITEA